MSDDRAVEFMDFVYRHIMHGDDEHREWLRNKCDELKPKLSKIFQSIDPPKKTAIKTTDLKMWSDPGWAELKQAAQRLKKSNVRIPWYDPDMEQDLPE